MRLEDFVMREISLRSGRKQPVYQPALERLEERATPATRTTLVSITNASPIIFSGQSALAVQFRLDATTNYGTVVCFQFTNPALVANTQVAYLQKLTGGVWRTIDSAVPEPTRIFLDNFGVVRTENPVDFRLLVKLKPTLTAPVVDIPMTRFGFTGTVGTAVFQGQSALRIVQASRMLSSTALWYLAQAGNNQVLGDVNIGIGPSGIRALVFRPATGFSLASMTNVRVYRTINGQIVGGPLGTTAPGANNSLIAYLRTRLDGVQSYRIVADLSAPMQISGLSYATT
jgi:hypothetical protein